MLEDRPGRERDARIDQHDGRPGKAVVNGFEFGARPASDTGAAFDTGRDICAESGGALVPVLGQAMALFHDAEHGPGIGRSTAKPRRHGKVLFKRDRKPVGAGQLGQRSGYEIIERIVETTRKLADDIHGILRHTRCRQHITRIDEGEQRLKLVIAILPPPANMQRQVDLGICGFDMGHATTPRHCERSQTILGAITRIAASLSPSQ